MAEMANIAPSLPKFPKRCRLQIEAKLRDFAPASDVWLCFAPIRQGRIELVVEKATELGIGSLLPVLTKRTQIAKVNIERLAAQAREAAEQSERLDVPEIAAAVSLEKLLAGWPTQRTLFFCQERSAAMPLLKAAAAVQTAPCALLIGPEGGFAPEEMTLINDTPGTVAVSLGPTILRAETAAIAALAILQAARQN